MIGTTLFKIQLACFLAFVSAPLHGQEEQGEIVIRAVKGTPTGAIAAFTEEMIQPGENGRVSRWASHLCLDIRGVSPEQTAFFMARFRRVGHSLGLQVLPRGDCAPSALVIFAAEGEAMARELATQRVDLLAMAGKKDRDAFLASTAPVRRLAEGNLRSEDGQTPQGFSLDAKNPAAIPAAANKGFMASRLTSGARLDLSRMLVLVDAAKLDGASNRQIADYLVMTVIGNVDPARIEVGRNSIMGLYARRHGSGHAESLTAWDESFLASLYDGAWNGDGSRVTRRIRSDMLRSGFLKD
ncbi:hypothetical protein [Pacificimonas flava]|uniref:hypothetical protein n=1 Tax=Pacificimonas flava TaxID=1234595 RepID=UPI0004BCAE83|nr:hypothetical protein [Pacificimonas flava]MBB5281002.1 hypothetical protein [Pacificimonas flava]